MSAEVVGAAPVYEGLRLTIPAREALESAGNSVAAAGGAWTVTLRGTVPAGIVPVLIGHGADQCHGLRLDSEPEYPGEWRATAIAWHERGEWVPCPAPRCRRALVWYEAGYVPGYRICTRGHHSQLSADGRSAALVRR